MSQVWADWDAYSDDCEYMAAGTTYMDRNARLVALGDMLLAFPATRAEELRSGTWSTIRRARKAGKRIVIVPLDGTEPWEEN
jgi:predicted Rossmann fold nucleotide-binding protein DprA/Smf involved in DNA uptake